MTTQNKYNYPVDDGFRHRHSWVDAFADHLLASQQRALVGSREHSDALGVARKAV
jgi:hypothetical protein